MELLRNPISGVSRWNQILLCFWPVTDWPGHQTRSSRFRSTKHRMAPTQRRVRSRDHLKTGSRGLNNSWRASLSMVIQELRTQIRRQEQPVVFTLKAMQSNMNNAAERRPFLDKPKHSLASQRLTPVATGIAQQEVLTTSLWQPQSNCNWHPAYIG